MPRQVVHVLNGQAFYFKLRHYLELAIDTTTQVTAWAANDDMRVDRVLQNTRLGDEALPAQIRAWSAAGPFLDIGSLDGALLTMSVTRSLLPKIVYVGLTADEYLILGQPISCLDAAATPPATVPPPVEWPLGITKIARTREWVRLVPTPYRPTDPNGPPLLGFHLDYASYTPLRVADFTARADRHQMAISHL